MTLPTLQIILQSISSFAIAGGLLYSAFQFRHWRKAQHVANFSKLVELQMNLRRMRVDDPSLARVYKHDVSHAESDEDIRAYFMNLMQLSLFEIAWFGHRHGQIPDDYYQSWSNRMKFIQAEESFRKMWATPAMKILHDDFQKHIQDLMDRDAAAEIAARPAAPVPAKVS